MKTVTLIAALLNALSLVACTEPDAALYPTETFEETRADGTQVTTYGAHAGPVCAAIAAVACDSPGCEETFVANCRPAGEDSIIATSNVAAWDELWANCFDGISNIGLQLANYRGGYTGNIGIRGCEKLTPHWNGL